MYRQSLLNKFMRNGYPGTLISHNNAKLVNGGQDIHIHGLNSSEQSANESSDFQDANPREALQELFNAAGAPKESSSSEFYFQQNANG